MRSCRRTIESVCQSVLCGYGCTYKDSTRYVLLFLQEADILSGVDDVQRMTSVAEAFNADDSVSIAVYWKMMLRIIMTRSNLVNYPLNLKAGQPTD